MQKRCESCGVEYPSIYFVKSEASPSGVLCTKCYDLSVVRERGALMPDGKEMATTEAALTAEEAAFPESLQELREIDTGLRRPTTKEAAFPESLPFNFGACFITILWLFFHGRSGTAVLLILYNLVSRLSILLGPAGVIMNLLVVIMISFYFGTQGSEIAWKYKGYTNLEELKRRQRPWNIAGGIFGVLEIAWLIIGLVSLSGRS
jgi:hypothetical protein